MDKRRIIIVLYLLWSIYSIGFGLSLIIHGIWALKAILIYGSCVWIEPNVFIAVFEIISLSVSFVWVFVTGILWCLLLISEFKKEWEEKLRLWCTKCDIDLIKKGIALDCPEDGIFYKCPSCNYRIVSFKKGAE